MTAAFETLLKSDLEDLQRGLLKETQEGHLSSTDVRDILSRCSNLHFPGLITLLALGARTTDHDSQTPAFPLTHERIADTLSRLSAHNAPEAETAKRAGQLLLTGQFFGDLAEAFAVIAHTVPGLPFYIADDVRALPQAPTPLIQAITRDLGEIPSAIDVVIQDLRRDGTITSQPTVMTHTMRAIYRQATARRLATTIHSLLGNESIRLAIIIFARSKGITISQEDLDQVRKAIDPSAPNLGELLAPGYRQLSKRYGKDQAIEILKQFAV
ncbi:MAG: hypothetical protein OEV77_06620 [Nitrospira sp.]|nr:hypothetical protein [Nitrospira sp.]